MFNMMAAHSWEHDYINDAYRRGVCFGGKGGGGPTTSTSVSTNLPEYARPYFESMMSRAQGASEEPYIPYTGQRIADFTSDTTSAMGGIRNLGDTYGQDVALGRTGVNTALDAAQGIQGYQSNPISSNYIAGNYSPTSFDGGRFDSGAAQQYMSPYIQNVLDVGKREAIRQAGIAGVQRQAQQSGGEAFGGYRSALENAEADRNLQQRLSDIQTTGMESAYNTGMQQFNADQARALQAGQMGEQSRQYGAGLTDQMRQAENQMGMQAGISNEQLRQAAAGLGLQGGQLGLSAGQGAAGIGALNRQLTGSDLNALLQSGGLQQAQNQSQLDVALQDFINQRDYPKQQLSWMSGIMRGVPVSSQSETSQYNTQGNSVAQLLGSGISALGVAKMMGS